MLGEVWSSVQSSDVDPLELGTPRDGCGSPFQARLPDHEAARLIIVATSPQKTGLVQTTSSPWGLAVSLGAVFYVLLPHERA